MSLKKSVFLERKAFYTDKTWQRKEGGYWKGEHSCCGSRCHSYHKANCLKVLTQDDYSDLKDIN